MRAARLLLVLSICLTSGPSNVIARRLAIGLDVGTGSARAGVVNTANGELLATAKRDIKTWNPKAEYYEQSSDDVWESCVTCVRTAMRTADVSPADEIVGIGFDATCSLVCLDNNNEPVGTDPTVPDDDERNIILWMDHRATTQASTINALGHDRLQTVGGTISPEMEVPKMLWLRNHLPSAFERCNSGGKFLDLTDFLSYRATDYAHDVRSLCTVVCKWAYDANSEGTGLGWDRSFLEQVGFGGDELPPEIIGRTVRAPGEAIPGGLGKVAASQLGLPAGTPLAVGMIDAHAGGIGCLGATLPGNGHGEEDGDVGNVPLTSRMALIAGTSTCHMASSVQPKFVPGVWGPYYSAMLPGIHLNEGGQSAAGALLDHIIGTHPAHAELATLAEQAGLPPAIVLNQRLAEMVEEERGGGGVRLAELSADVHVTPDFLGNRSPLADPTMRGGIVGLGMSATLDDLAVLYLATMQALAYQTRAIIDALAYSPPISAVVACGGLSKNELFLSTNADVLGMPLHTPKQDEAVLLGASILGATAGKAYASIEDAMAAMSEVGSTVYPQREDAAYHERKYQVFRQMNEDQIAYREMMQKRPA